jgi:NTE family protein
MRLHLVVLIIIIQCHNLFSQKQYENLVFEGAGIRGLAYSGVIKGLEDLGMMNEIKRVGGTSAGAITAMMLSIGYDSGEIYEIISKTDFQKFNKGKFGILGGFNRINKRYGWYINDKFEKWLEDLIENKTGDSEITFKELGERGYKELHATGTCINKQELIVFNSVTYPKMKVKDAIKISMSIPLYFEAIFLDSEGKLYNKQEEGFNLDVVVDGGLIGNYPIGIFDRFLIDSLGRSYREINTKTLGIRMDSDEQIKNDKNGLGLVEQKITDFRSYIEAFYIMTIENLNRNQLTKEDWNRTISVSSVNIGPKIKRLKQTEKESLMKSGEEAVIAYFRK